MSAHGTYRDGPNETVLPGMHRLYRLLGPLFFAEGEVHHRVCEALMPRMTDTTLTRKYQFAGDRLTLTATTRDMQDQLIWRRHE